MARNLAAASGALVLLLLIGSAFGDYAMVNEPYGVTTVGDATFYGDQQGNGVDGGNCGYLGLRRNVGNLDYMPYGLNISAVSYPLWQDGAGCGACYTVKCVDDPLCIDRDMIVTVTDFCPDQGWCDPWKKHFDLGGAVFPALAQIQAGHVPLSFERVPCPRQGPIVLRLMGNPFWLSILSENVGGAGTTDGMEIQMAGNPDWISLTHDWGGYFKITGQSFEGPLSVRLTQKLTGEQVVLKNCIPNSWVPNTEYTCDANFGSNSFPTVQPAADSQTSNLQTSAPVVPEQPQTPEPILIQIPSATDPSTQAPENPQTPKPTDAQTPAPTDAQTPKPADAQTPAPTDAQTLTPTDAQTPKPTDAQTPKPTDAQTPKPTDAQTPAPTDAQTPAPTDAQIPAPTNPQTPAPTTAQISSPAAPVIVPVVTSAPASNDGGPAAVIQTGVPAPIAPTPVTTTILADPTAPIDTTGGSCVSWAQGQSHRRLLDSSTVQLCTRVVSEWTQGDGTQVAQYQLTVINNGKTPLTGVTIALTNFSPWYGQFWKFNYDTATQTATLPDWQVALPAGQSFEFGYIQAGASGATFSIQDVQFAATARRRNR